MLLTVCSEKDQTFISYSQSNITCVSQHESGVIQSSTLTGAGKAMRVVGRPVVTRVTATLRGARVGCRRVGGAPRAPRTPGGVLELAGGTNWGKGEEL